MMNLLKSAKDYLLHSSYPPLYKKVKEAGNIWEEIQGWQYKLTVHQLKRTTKYVNIKKWVFIECLPYILSTKKTNDIPQKEILLSDLTNYREDCLRIFWGQPKTPAESFILVESFSLWSSHLHSLSIWEPNLVSNSLGTEPCTESKTPRSQWGSLSITSCSCKNKREQ